MIANLWLPGTDMHLPVRRSLFAIALLSMAAICAPRVASAQGQITLIRNGRLLDGMGNPWRYGDVVIQGDRIVAVGDGSAFEPDVVVDATGLYVAPGFIDAHSHSGPGLASPELSHAEPLLAMGLTTVFINPDGGGPVDQARQRGHERAVNTVLYQNFDMPWRDRHSDAAIAGSADISNRVTVTVERLQIFGRFEYPQAQRDRAGNGCARLDPRSDVRG